jgi:hypothetical protein
MLNFNLSILKAIVMNSKSLLLLPFLFLLLVCCRHKEDVAPVSKPSPHGHLDCGQTEFNEIDNSLMQQFLFKSGTYWIYKDSVNNTIDSCFCYGMKIKSGTYEYGGGATPGTGFCLDHYRFAMDSTNQHQADSARYIYYIQDKYMRVVSPFGFAAVALCVNNSGNLTGDSLSVFYPTITINAVAYSNVYKFHFKTHYGSIREAYFYMKPGVGIIKTDLWTTDSPAVHKVNELVKYHIE